MEKVVLTKEQAEVIQKLYDFIHDNDVLNNGITARKLSGIIKHGYEVEETFEVGDWVITNFFGYAKGRALKIKQITKRKDKTYVYFMNLEEPTHNCYIEDICRHATPKEIAKEKERRWWAEHGREVWELRRYDLLSDKDGCSYTIDLIKENHVEFVEFGMRKLKNEIEKGFKVVCFAEDRKDVSN